MRDLVTWIKLYCATVVAAILILAIFAKIDPFFAVMLGGVVANGCIVIIEYYPTERRHKKERIDKK